MRTSLPAAIECAAVHAGIYIYVCICCVSYLICAFLDRPNYARAACMVKRWMAESGKLGTLHLEDNMPVST